ncbi:DUF397 domain-containing protein [Actinosynnema sp. NPDC023794]
MSLDETTGRAWRKSSRSGGSGAQCVEVAVGQETTGVRDSKKPDGERLTFSTAAWLSFSRSFKR